MTKVTKYIAIICLLIQHLFVLIFYAVDIIVAFAGHARFNKITIKIVSFLIGFNNTAGTFVCVFRVSRLVLSRLCLSLQWQSMPTTRWYRFGGGSENAGQRTPTDNHRREVGWFTEKLTSDFDQSQAKNEREKTPVISSSELVFLWRPFPLISLGSFICENTHNTAENNKSKLLNK